MVDVVAQSGIAVTVLGDVGAAGIVDAEELVVAVLPRLVGDAHTEVLVVLDLSE